ncbi:Sec14p-like phosphatidylinositol transfer family protein [Striga asiatica]|uniref:Sec14p-like phosphatidylinositol transfer family protein n=1 Tax=Striga asiatica TaxID=4170 RepID=A0A5A7PJN4_STRAF|nr:Sec14p-like phosphatidylinositol transfer family protein [Striga asiatica]
MGFVTEEAIKLFQSHLDRIDDPLKKTFQNIHNGYQRETLLRFLKARDGDVSNAHKMLIDCLNWRIQNDIDDILAKPIIPTDVYRGIRDSQLLGMSGFSKQGLPVIVVGVGLSTFDKASPSATKKYGRYIGTCIKILDMTGLKLSALNQIKLLSAISTIDDLNYPEKTETYYIVNAPYIFSSCWKIMDYESLPHFCRREGSGSSRHYKNGTMTSDCFSLDHAFHQQLYSYIKSQAESNSGPTKHGSLHMDIPEPDPEDVKIAQSIESEIHKLENKNGLSHSLHELRISGD